MEYILTTLVSLLTMIITVTITNRRIESRDSEQHKPYIVLDNVSLNQKLDIYRYYLIFIGENYRQQNKGLENNQLIENNKDNLSINLIIKNIGYGVATNVKFYDLLTGKQIIGIQSATNDENQKLFTTLDVADGEEKKIQVRLLAEMNEHNIEHNRIMCVYKDLNEHVYTFLFAVNVKDKAHYDFFSYQPSSHSYQRWVKENKKQYKEILQRYNDL